jgi:hypothetical protein
MSFRPSPHTRRSVSRSFRIPAKVDKLLQKEAGKRDISKSRLIHDVLVSWYNFNVASEKIDGAVAPETGETAE